MLRRPIIIFSLMLALLIAVEPRSITNTMVLSEAEIAALDAADAAPDNEMKSDGKGNVFAKVLKAPFKAIGRIFGKGGKKEDDNKFHRLTEKDVQKFTSAPNTRLIGVTNAEPSAVTAADENGDAKTHLERGRSLLNKGQLNDAIRELSKAASLDTKLAEAYNLLGVAYQFKGLRGWAMSAFQTALKLEKSNPQLLNNYGYLLYLNGAYEEALKQLSKASRLAPDDARILNNLAMTQSQLGRYDDAFKNFVRAGGEVYGRLNIANRLQLAGRTDEAIKYFEAAKLTAENQKKEDPNAQAITVVLEIKNGKIAFASVPDRRPGLEAYEASALRYARKLRYSADTNGSDSVVVRVSPTPGL